MKTNHDLRKKSARAPLAYACFAVLILGLMCGSLAAQSARFTTGAPTQTKTIDNTLTVLLPLVNSGTGAATNVRATQITLASASRLTPFQTALPVALGQAGTINANQTATLNLRFDASAQVTGARYLLTVRGTYVSEGATYGFAVNRYLTSPAVTQPAPCAVPAQLRTDLNAAAQGSTISLAGINPLNCPQVPTREAWSGGKLILSDSPETPATPGKLYEDATLSATTNGNPNRIFLYHVNGNAATRMKFAVLVTNTGGDAGVLRIERRGTAGPTTAYAYAGKLAFQRWLDSAPGADVTVAAGGTVRLDPTFDSVSALVNNLMHAIWDYSFTQPHRITIVAVAAADDPLATAPTLPLLARDVHVRGTFPSADKSYETATGYAIDTANGVQQFPIVNHTASDTYGVGVDATDGTPMTNSGNYGVLYRIRLALAATDGRNLGVVINPRGGGWGGALEATPGITPGGRFLIPTGTALLSDNTRAAIAGKYAPAQTPAPTYLFMPTGGSAFPLRFVFVPF